jgi:hypothetical protein
MITASICLTDIPKEKITVSQTNGKKYLNIVIDTLKEVDDKGNTHNIWASQTKEERAAKAKKQYLGRGKDWNSGKQESKSTPTPAEITEPLDDLPF